MAFENTTRFPDFQAEYEGSIPFTRSKTISKTWREGRIHSDKGAALHVLMPRFPICCFACRLIRCRIPRTAPDRFEVRAHQNRISWFGEEVLNARVEIGGDGVKLGQVEHRDCEDLRR